MPRQLKADEIKMVMSLRKEDVDVDLIKDWFTSPDFTTPPKFETNDYFTLPANSYFNPETIQTTVGRYLINVFVYPKRFLNLYHYINVPLDKKKFGSIESQMGIYLMNDEITTDDYKEYIDNAVWLFLGQSYLINPSMDSNVVIPIDKVIKDRDKMFEENAEKIAEGDSDTVDKIESTLKAEAKQILKERKARSMEYYDSGVASFDNAYKKTAIMVGGIQNPGNGKIMMVKSNFTDGLKKDEYGVASHLTVSGGYARAEGTKQGGYTNKKILNTTSLMSLDEDGSDCNTPFTLSIKLTPDIANVMTDRYIVENGKLVLLDYKTLPKYVGKTVQLRSPLFCHGDKICSKCAGEQFYKMDAKNIGVHASAMGGRLLNLGLKKFHDATLEFYTLDLNNFIE